MLHLVMKPGSVIPAQDANLNDFRLAEASQLGTGE
jgi:hypothetical protein